MLKGIFPPLVTPFCENESIDWEGLRLNLELYNATGLDGYVVLGTNGEFPLLQKEEKIELIQFVRLHAHREKQVIAGTGAESTQETIALSREAARCGVDAVLILPPHYYKGSMNEAILEKHFLSLADAINVPVFLYNMPLNTGINLSPSLVIRLARHPNIIGIKDTSGNIVQIAEIIAGTPDSFSVFAGSASFLLPTLILGGKGGTLALANVLPDLCVEIYQAVERGDYDKARTLQLQILEANTAVTTRWGIAGAKMAMNLLGYRGGFLRKPLLPLDPSFIPELKRILQEAGAPI